jgi:hypothetical protein
LDFANNGNFCRHVFYAAKNMPSTDIVKSSSFRSRRPIFFASVRFCPALFFIRAKDQYGFTGGGGNIAYGPSPPLACVLLSAELDASVMEASRRVEIE